MHGFCLQFVVLVAFKTLNLVYHAVTQVFEKLVGAASGAMGGSASEHGVELTCRDFFDSHSVYYDDTALCDGYHVRHAFNDGAGR